jgi:hypothetical protein
MNHDQLAAGWCPSESEGFTVDTTASAEDLVATLVGPGVMVKNINFRGAASQVATFTDAEKSF